MNALSGLTSASHTRPSDLFIAPVQFTQTSASHTRPSDLFIAPGQLTQTSASNRAFDSDTADDHMEATSELSTTSYPGTTTFSSVTNQALITTQSGYLLPSASTTTFDSLLATPIASPPPSGPVEVITSITTTFVLTTFGSKIDSDDMEDRYELASLSSASVTLVPGNSGFLVPSATVLGQTVNTYL